MVLILKESIDHCNTNHQGEIVLNLIRKRLIDGENVVISFKDISSVSSSFLNSAFIPLLDDLNYDQIIKQISFIDSNKHINSSIVRRFKLEIDHTQLH